MAFEHIIYQKDEGIATLTLNRPKVLNALLYQTYNELSDAINDANKDAEVRVLVITGNGRAFCSGDDVRSMWQTPDWNSADNVSREAIARRGKGIHNPVTKAMIDFGKPSIAAVNGPAVGWGIELALWCDMRIAAETARFGEVFVRRGLMPSPAGTYLLRLMVGLAKAYELLYTGDIIDAREAYRIGLVNRVVPDDQLQQVTREFALKLAKGAPIAQQFIKEAMKKGLELPLQSVTEYISQGQGLLRLTADHREAARAWVEKREPVFKGE